VTVVVAVATLVYEGIYLRLGFSRWTVLLSCLSVFLATPLWVYAITRRTFVWGSRRYRWRSMFDVEVAERRTRTPCPTGFGVDYRHRILTCESVLPAT
jgi:hypothetical protein